MSNSQEPLRRKSFIPLVALSAAAVLVAGFTYFARAEDPAGEAADQEPAAEETTEEAPQADIFAVPETDDLQELGAFIDTLQNFTPTSRAEYMEYQEKAPEALLTAAERVMELGPEEGTPAYQQAKGVLLQASLPDLFTSETPERQQIINDILNHLENSELDIPEARLAMQLAQMLDYIEEPELQVEALERMVEIFDNQESQLMAQVAGSFEGMLRRAKLMGSVMEISGTTIDGEEFNIEQLRGHVVLVDFWATWCGPCVAEHPNILQNYEKYHDQGFEVVGISLDDDRKALVDYLAEHEVPWYTLYNDDGPNPAAEEYGINAIPAMFLLDAEGKVISDSARGPELDRLLGEIYGTPAEEAPAEDGASE